MDDKIQSKDNWNQDLMSTNTTINDSQLTLDVTTNNTIVNDMNVTNQLTNKPILNKHFPSQTNTTTVNHSQKSLFIPSNLITNQSFPPAFDKQKNYQTLSDVIAIIQHLSSFRNWWSYRQAQKVVAITSMAYKVIKYISNASNRANMIQNLCQQIISDYQLLHQYIGRHYNPISFLAIKNHNNQSVI